MALALTGSPQITAAALDAAVNAELTANWAPLAGVTTNSNAAAGQVGEYISSTIAVGSAVSLTSNVAANVTSISLTAGDWDVSGVVITNPGGTTVTISVATSISITTATPQPPNQATVYPGNTAGAFTALALPTVRMSLAVTTTIFLVANANFSTSTLAAFGFIGARRAR